MIRTFSTPTKARRATTVLELLVAMSVLFMIFAGVTAVLIQGLGYLRTQQGALDAQRGALLVMNSLSREVEHTKYIFADPEPTGLVFADPYGGHNDTALNITENMQTNASGQLLWQRYVCFFLDVPNSKLYRREAPYTAFPPASPPFYPPIEGPNVCQALGTPPLNVTWFAGQSGYATKLVADDICAFNCTAKTVPIPSGGGSVPVINVTLGAGDPAAKTGDNSKYWFQLQTQISPRN
eukprot:TRINITY_DN41509_c0_g1_i1.p1 TRINITY_DN41509_c0_g1~~TRINITY_DN41509_c0_g1_i1.p1  ORF type:complete len:238 (-),score=18.20 TRINITY_DN41509_c0_g1_i1:241-954(-)